MMYIQKKDTNNLEMHGKYNVRQMLNDFPQYKDYDLVLMVPREGNEKVIDLKYGGKASHSILHNHWIINHIDENKQNIWIKEK